MSHNTNEMSLLQFIEARFVAAVSPSSNNFYYDTTQKSLIATHPEFGNQYLNDHHFHYGYYIRSAAILSQLDSSFYRKNTQNWQSTITLMVSDIATSDRTSETFPYLRNFDVYQGHSWASGYDGFVPASGTSPAGVGFADGPNQESSSEAMNAWYGIYLWSLVTQNMTLKDTALYLYNTEMEGIFFYWFGENNLYTAPYQHSIASLVWDGKVDFATFFGDDTFFKYGIQLLPFTPGSIYLSQLPPSLFARYNYDYHNSPSNSSATHDISNAGKGSETGVWGDIFTIWESMYEPKQTISYSTSIPVSFFSQTSPYYHQIPRALFLYELYQHNGE